jgi:hypothetical protein
MLWRGALERLGAEWDAWCGWEIGEGKVAVGRAFGGASVYSEGRRRRGELDWMILYVVKSCREEVPTYSHPSRR